MLVGTAGDGGLWRQVHARDRPIPDRMLIWPSHHPEEADDLLRVFVLIYTHLYDETQGTMKHKEL